MLLAFGALLWSAPAAHAATGDVVTKYDIAYVVDDAGTVHVTETMDYAFGSSGRHGITRTLLTRVPYDKDQDRQYKIQNFTVSSPTGAATNLSRSSASSNGGRSETTAYRIGDKNKTVDQTETYVLKYDIVGALNPQRAADTQLYWNVIDDSLGAQLTNVTVTVTVPGGIRDVKCFTGSPGTRMQCQSATLDAGVAVFNQNQVNGQLTIAVSMDSAQATKTLLVPRATWLNQRGITPLNVSLAGGVTVVGLAMTILLMRRMRDERYLDLPPGVTPAAGADGRVGPSPGRIEIPVAFAPPRDVHPAYISLLEGQRVKRDTLAATLVQLGYRGAIKMSGVPGSITLLDSEKTEYDVERRVLKAIFPSSKAGESAPIKPKLSKKVAKRYDKAYRAITPFCKAFIDDPKRRLVRQNARRLDGSVGMALLLVLLIGFLATIGALIVPWPSLPWGIGLLIVGGGGLLLRLLFMDNALTAQGRAVADQVAGFRTYLKTAEAEQLKFEEGEDIFSKYLSWAIMFGQTKRWATVCAELVEQGRIPQQPDWYGGSNWNIVTSAALMSSFNHQVGSGAAAIAAPASSAGSAGSSGGSGFSGSFSGGGGGGGSVGSW
ncbi:MAG: DUF2207 domain-containing protein [Antricoccus sp.]